MNKLYMMTTMTYILPICVCLSSMKASEEIVLNEYEAYKDYPGDYKYIKWKG